MDEKVFDQRLQQLKSSYENIPTFSNSDDLIKRLKNTEKQRVKRKMIHYPYVASFLGVLLLAGILVTQIVSQNQQQGAKSEKISPVEENQANKVSKEMIEQKSNELEALYLQKIEKLKKDLNFENVESYNFVLQAKTLLTNFKESSPKIYAGQENLEIRFQETRQLIERKLMTPREEIALLSNGQSVKEGKGVAIITDGQMLSLIEKLEELLPFYQDNWNEQYQPYSKKINQSIGENTDVASVILSKSEFNTGSFSGLTLELIKNGYYISNDNGQIRVAINYAYRSEYGYQSLDSLAKMSDQMTQYLQLEQVYQHFEVDDKLLVEWDAVFSQMVLIESFIKQNPDFPRNQVLFEHYSRYFNSYCNNYLSDFSSIYDENQVLKKDVQESYERSIAKYSETETGKALVAFYNKLKNHNFEFLNETIVVPQLVPYQEPVRNVEIIENETIDLDGELMSIYKQYRSKQMDQMLKGLRPVDVMKIYMYASDNGDPETVYALYYKGKDEAIPSVEKFMNEWGMSGNTNFAEDFKDVNSFNEIFHGENEASVELISSDGNTLGSFQMYLENGVWKAGWLPMQ